VALSTGTAHAELVSVDPGKALGAGKPITGSGQNLASLNATEYWNIGSNPASLVTTYYTSGEALRDQAEVTAAALKWTRSWVKKECGSTMPTKVRACKAAAVFDVDETLLSNYDWFAKADPQFTYDATAEAVANANCTLPVIEPTRALFDSFKKLGVTPFIITGRPESDRAATAACLTKAGITGYADLILKPEGNNQTAAVRKSDQRKALIRKGWKIGPSIGDQISDMARGSMAHGFLLPNGMYFIP
jgi:acid phosphatase